jgi:hypothetical protein
MLVVNFDELQNVTSTEGHYNGGACVYAGWKQVVQSLIEAGWGRLRPGEHIKQAKIDENGVTLVIEMGSQ